MTAHNSQTIESVLVENRVFPPTPSQAAHARIQGMAGYEALCAEAQRDLPEFWAKRARVRPIAKVADR